MAKTPMRCPFNDKLCIECTLYRGRHYYLCNCEHYRGYIKPKDKVNSDRKLDSAGFDKIKALLEPWSVIPNKVKENAFEPKIKLKIIDMETGKQSTCIPAEAKTWKWDNPSIMRIINGSQINSWTKLAELMQYQEEKGAKELVIYEGPRFMMIAGG
jgi:hypothetical protein